MKQKKIFILAAAALAFAACSSDESPTAPEQQETGAAYTQGEVPVAFGAYVDRATTRAGLTGDLTTSTLSLPEASDGGFGVFAYYTDNETYTENSKPNFMYNQKVHYNSGWTYSPVKYWPNEYGADAKSDGVDKLTFFAYAPYVAVDLNTGVVTGTGVDTKNGIVALTRNTTHGNPMVKYYASMEPGLRVDLCYGVAKSDFSSAVTGGPANTIQEGKPYVNVTKPNTTDKINFNFVHALAALNVTIDADVDETAHGGTAYLDGTTTKIYVRSVTFEGFTNKGMLDLYSDVQSGVNKPVWYDLTGINTIGSGTVTIYDGRRDGREGQANSEASNETPNELNQNIIQKSTSTNGVPANGLVNLFKSDTPTEPIFVIPTDQAVKITIVYDVETADPNLPTFLSDGVTRGSSVENCITKDIKLGSADLKLVAGKAYTIGLHLGMTSVKFDASVTAWPTTPEAADPTFLPNN